ncbi:MAG: hypothetical protein PHX43_04085 [Alphaproteobacteria bacterium]|nr:hypothetical protein [Alphaproteobacteria bacterium]
MNKLSFEEDDLNSILTYEERSYISEVDESNGARNYFVDDLPEELIVIGVKRSAATGIKRSAFDVIEKLPSNKKSIFRACTLSKFRAYAL